MHSDFISTFFMIIKDLICTRTNFKLTLFDNYEKRETKVEDKLLSRYRSIFLYIRKERRIFNFLRKSWVKFVKMSYTKIAEKLFYIHSKTPLKSFFLYILKKLPQVDIYKTFNFKPLLDQQRRKFRHTHIHQPTKRHINQTDKQTCGKVMKIILIKKHRETFGNDFQRGEWVKWQQWALLNVNYH